MIRSVDYKARAAELTAVLHAAFGTVTAEFGITAKNAPGHPAFMTPDMMLEGFRDKTVEFYVYEMDAQTVGTVAVTEHEGKYQIERLAVLPEYRHSGAGRALMEHAEARIRALGGHEAGIAIVAGNLVLRRWYEKLGYRETRTVSYDHLPFMVTYMKKQLNGSTTGLSG